MTNIILLNLFQVLSRFYSFVMQAHDDLEPTVQIRELKKDRVNFVLKNVDLACVLAHYNMTYRLSQALIVSLIH